MADFAVINSRLATGAAISSEADVEQLVEAGVGAVIDCRDDFDDASLLASHPNLLYLWNGTPDDGSVKPDSWFGASLSFGLAFLATPHGILYCHCAAGVNRGPSTATLIMIAQGWTPGQAEAAIRAVRPQVGLAYLTQGEDAVRRLGFG